MTTDRDGNRSNPYKPNPEHCCEACVFGRGEHASWCTAAKACLRCGEVHYFATPRCLDGIPAQAGAAYEFNPSNGIPK